MLLVSKTPTTVQDEENFASLLRVSPALIAMPLRLYREVTLERQDLRHEGIEELIQTKPSKRKLCLSFLGIWQSSTLLWGGRCENELQALTDEKRSEKLPAVEARGPRNLLSQGYSETVGVLPSARANGRRPVLAAAHQSGARREALERQFYGGEKFGPGVEGFVPQRTQRRWTASWQVCPLY